MFTLPNLLSVSRVFLAAPMFFFIIQGSWIPAAIVLWTAVAADMSDGYIARARGQTSALGGLLDHGSDALFVTVTITALVFTGWAPFLLPVVIPLAFLQYMLDSKALAGQPLRASFIGRYNGIAYFVFAGWPVMQLALGITIIPFDWFIWIGWGLVITTLISMTDRLVTLLASNSQR